MTEEEKEERREKKKDGDCLGITAYLKEMSAEDHKEPELTGFLNMGLL